MRSMNSSVCAAMIASPAEGQRTCTSPSLAECSMDGFMSLSGLRPWPEERLAEFGRRQYYGLEAGAHDAQGRIDRCARATAVQTMSMPQERAPAVPGSTATLNLILVCAQLQCISTGSGTLCAGIPPGVLSTV